MGEAPFSWSKALQYHGTAIAGGAVTQDRFTLREGSVAGLPGLQQRLGAGIEMVKRSAATLPRRPQVYFEDWNDPLISGIGWVSELIGIAGGVDCFADRAHAPLAGDRTIHDPQEVVRRQPDIIIGSWCGKKFQPSQVAQRPGWENIPALRHGHVYEIKSADILQPGPAALGDGLRQLHEVIKHWAAALSHA
jgi:iron complex transport system substrate-binding protein